MRVITVSLLLFSALPVIVSADAELYLSPQAQRYTIGESFVVEVLLDASPEKVSAVEAELTFDQKTLEIESISVEGSLLDSWSTTPTFSNQSAGIRFTGWAAKDFTGTAGKLLTISVRARAPGIGTIQFLSGSVLARDGRGSNILSKMRSGAYSIEPLTSLESSPSDEPPETRPLGTDTALQPQVLGTTSEIAAPQFSEYAGTIFSGESIRLKGKTEPNSKVIVRVMGATGDIDESAVSSFDDGTFTYASIPLSEPGVYRVVASVEQDEGYRSDESERLVITVQSKPSVISWLVASFSLYGPFIGLILFTGLVIGYYMHREARIRHLG